MSFAIHLASPRAPAAANARSIAPSLFQRAVRALDKTFGASGRHRAQHELRLLAEHWDESQPQLAKELRQIVWRGV